MGRKWTFSLIENQTTIARRKKPRLFYGYILVAIAVCIEIIAWGIYNSFGVFFNSWLAEFEWSRATLSGTASLSQIMVGLGAIFFGNLNDRLDIVPYTVDLGYSTSFSALILAVIGGTSIAGRFVLGTIGDRTGKKRAILLSFIILIMAFIWLQVTERLWQLFVFAVVYGFAHGGFYALISPVVAEFFGLRSHGLIFGVIVFVSSIGGASGPLVAGNIYDLSASYNIAFLILMELSLIGFISVLISGSNEKKAVALDNA
jgi:MFS family permease